MFLSSILNITMCIYRKNQGTAESFLEVHKYIESPVTFQVPLVGLSTSCLR